MSKPKSAPRDPHAGADHPAATPGYSIGELVSHPQFGDGIVRAIDGDKLTIEFAGNAVKHIVDYYVKRRK